MSRFNNNKVIIILGPPGSGKGTQGELLAEKFNLYHLETSEIIERNFANIKKSDFVKVGKKKYFLWKERKLRQTGKLMSPPLIFFWVEEKIKEVIKEDKGIVLSGSFKTLYEAEELTPFIKKVYGPSSIRVILLKQRPEVSIFRNSRRRICELMRHSLLYSKETARLKTCPFDGSKLIHREDNKPAVIREKLQEFKERTMPVVGYFKKHGVRVLEINGEQSVADVFKDILEKLR
jgi:adenylate kinase